MFLRGFLKKILEKFLFLGILSEICVRFLLKIFSGLPLEIDLGIFVQKILRKSFNEFLSSSRWIFQSSTENLPGNPSETPPEIILEIAWGIYVQKSLQKYLKKSNMILAEVFPGILWEILQDFCKDICKKSFKDSIRNYFMGNFRNTFRNLFKKFFRNSFWIFCKVYFRIFFR